MSSIKFITLEDIMKESSNMRESDLKSLREWCERQPHLPKISDKDLAVFLHSNYYLMEPTKINIDTYYTLRSHIPEFFNDRDITKSSRLQTALEIAFSTPLEGTTREGYKIVYWKLLDSDATRFVHADIIKTHVMILDFWIQTQNISEGHMLVIDVKDVGMGHVARTSPMVAKKIVYYLQDALPVRLKGMHFINSSQAMDMILSIAKPFMKKKLIDMINTHTTMESLEKVIPVDILPNESGGRAGSVKEFHEASLKALRDMRDWFEQDELHGRVDESLRPGKPKNASELFGAEGSFKKLDID